MELYIFERPHTVHLLLLCDIENSVFVTGTAIVLNRQNETKYVRHPGCECSPLYSRSLLPWPFRRTTRLARRSSNAISYAGTGWQTHTCTQAHLLAQSTRVDKSFNYLDWPKRQLPPALSLTHWHANTHSRTHSNTHINSVSL